jgi:hypothetical protein
MHNIKVMENFETFPENICTPSYDQWFSSYDHCKLGEGVLLKIRFWTDQATWRNLDFKPTSNEKLTELGIQRL